MAVSVGGLNVDALAGYMWLELAQKVGVILLARSKGQHFLVYNGAEQVEFDAIPERRGGFSE